MGQSQHGREEGVRLPHRYLAVQSIATHLSSAGGDAPCGAAPSAPAPPKKKQHPLSSPRNLFLSLSLSPWLPPLPAKVWKTPSTQPLLPVLRLVLQHASVGL